MKFAISDLDKNYDICETLSKFNFCIGLLRLGIVYNCTFLKSDYFMSEKICADLKKKLHFKEEIMLFSITPKGPQNRKTLTFSRCKIIVI